MSRSFVLTTLIVLLSGIGCRTQEPTSGLQESVARLEQRLARMDEYLKSMQQQKQEQAQASKEREFANVAQIREELANQERTYRATLQQHERLAAEQQQAKHAYEQELAQLRKRSEAEKREQDARLEKTQREAEMLRAQLAKSQEAAGQRDGDHKQALELVANERRQIERLRAAIVGDLAKAEHGGADGARLREENERLRNRVSMLEHQLARATAAAQKADHPAPPPVAPPAAPGTIVIDNAEGEVHFHFHGPAPNVTLPPRPAAGTSSRPGSSSNPASSTAGPAGPLRVRAREDAPRRDEPAGDPGGGGEHEPAGKRIN